MSTLEELKRFLQPFKVDKTVPATFTCIAPSARLNIPDDALPELFRMLKKAYANGVIPTLTEKPKDPSPLRVDLDFRFPIPLQQEQRQMRVFEARHVEAILRVYYEVISEYIAGTPEQLRGYIMTKPAPVEFRSRIKDGIHIVFPHLVVSDVFQHLVRRRVLERAAEMFDGLTLCNNPEDVVDEAIISRNNWLMYGCSKPDNPPYAVTQIATYMDGQIQYLPVPDTSDEESVQMIELFSMRNKTELTPLRPGKEKDVQEFGDKVLPSLNKKRQDKIHERIFSTSRVMSGIKATASEEDFELARRLVRECLSPTRAESYEDWIQLGWCLRNIDHRLLESWVEFSRVSSKHVDGECQRLWNSMRCDGLSMGTLRMWAKTDNRQAYDQILDGNINDLVDKTIATDGAHFDVARVVHAMYKDKYRFISRDIWYVYDENRHRWVSTRDGHQLRKILSNNVVDKFSRRSIYWGDIARSTEDADDAKKFEDRKWKLLDIAKKLKMSNYKNGILTECKCLFTDEKFEERLDSARHLIGFENGVYDLSLHEFRDGQPDDFISFSTGVHYIPYNPLSQEAIDIEEFFSKVLRNPNVMRYVKDIFAMSLDGSLKQERFYIFTGSGSNGKSALCNLYQQAFGEYCCILPISLLTQKRAASNSAQSELERTKGRRFALMQEPSENEKMNIGLMKELTGGDKIMCRGLFKEPIEFRPQFKMILCCNDLPEIPSDDGGTWRRIRVIEFNSKFTDSPDPNKPSEFKADIQLSEKFERWTETFISMLIAHHKSLDPKNLYEPEEVTAATQSYRANNDIIGQWFQEAVLPMSGNRMKLNWNNVVRDFKEWYKNSGGKQREMPERQQIHAYVERHIGKPDAKKKCYIGYKYYTPNEMTLRALQEEEEEEAEAAAEAEAEAEASQS